MANALWLRYYNSWLLNTINSAIGTAESGHGMSWSARPHHPWRGGTQNQAVLTAMWAEREMGLDLTTISMSCPSATRKCIKRSTEKPSSL